MQNVIKNIFFLLEIRNKLLVMVVLQVSFCYRVKGLIESNRFLYIRVCKFTGHLRMRILQVHHADFLQYAIMIYLP